MAQQWVFEPKVEDLESRSAQLNMPPPFVQVLSNRSLTDAEAIRGFLEPQLTDLHEPALLPNISEAVQRILKAVKDRESIVIYGDYDVDGIAASAILYRALRLLGAKTVQVYIPHRIEEGYGLNGKALRQIADSGAGLVITVDCGVTSIKEVAAAREAGLDIIITDHHEPSPHLVPEALAILNPKMPGSSYPFRELSGAGVAFKLAWALGQELSPTQRVTPEFREFLLSATALAALGTIADVVPLVDENRALAHFGLRALSASKEPGIISLREIARCENRRLKAPDIAFGLAPRLNAAGRLGRADDAVKLLTTDDFGLARKIAWDLETKNVERQRIERRICEQAVQKVHEEIDLDRDRIIVLASEGWHAGVIGIVASKIVEQFHRPALLIALADGKGQGSARSVPGYSIFEAISTCEDMLTSFGGHAMAAGLRLEASQFEPLRKHLLKHSADALTPEELEQKLHVDVGVTLPEVTMELTLLLERLEPFGSGNRQPVLACDGVELSGQAWRFGRGGRHLSFHASQGGRTLRVLGWGKGDLANPLTRAATCAIAFTPKLNDFKGKVSIELTLADLWLGRYGDTDAQLTSPISADID